MSTSREQILLMLYEGAIKFTKGAIEHLKKDEKLECSQCCQRAFDIIQELQATLDFEKGGELAVNLNKLYDFMLMNLAVAGVGMDDVKLNGVLKVLENLHEGWSKALKNKGETNASSNDSP